MIPLWLLALLATSFAIGTDDMVVAGVLPAIAGDLDVSEAMAGQLVTVFSLTYAIGAPLMALVTARFPRRTLLLGALGCFVLTNVLAAFAPNYPVLMLLRVMAALTAATATPVSLGIASELAPVNRRGRYLGIITAGLTVSLVVGVPVGTWIGGSVGWRGSFILVSALGLAALLGISRTLPGVAQVEALGLRERLLPLRDRRITRALVGMVVTGSGGMMIYVYLAPISAGLADVDASRLAVLIAMFGAAGVAGSTLSGVGTDRYSARIMVAATFGGTAAGAAVLLGLTVLTPIPFWALMTAVAVYGVFVWSVSPPVQVRLLSLAGENAAQVLALNISALYVGFSGAGALGGLALLAFGVTGLLASSVVLMSLGSILVYRSMQEERVCVSVS